MTTIYMPTYLTECQLLCVPQRDDVIRVGTNLLLDESQQVLLIHARGRMNMSVHLRD